MDDNGGAEGPFSDISDDIVISMSKQPGKPKGVINSDQGVLLSWDVSSADIQAIDFFEIQWKKLEERRWSGRKFTENNSTSIIIPITDLKRNTAFQFKVRWATKDGKEGPFSDISDDIVISMTEQPGKPKGVINSDQGVLLCWDVSSADIEAIGFFEIQWKKREEQRWVGQKFTENNSTSITIPIKDLERNASFQFKVRWTTKDGIEGPFSDISDDIVISMSEQPGKPKGVKNSDQGVLLSWEVSSADLQVIDFFEIQWKKLEERRWSGRKFTDNNSTSITIPIKDLERNASFQFKVRWTTKDGVESPFSDISDDIVISMSQKPGKPEGNINSDQLLLSWYVSSADIQSIDFFEIQWKKREEQRWVGRKFTDNNSTSITIPIKDLERNASFQFKVRWTTKDGVEGQFSDISEDIVISMSQKPGKPKGVINSDQELLLSWYVSSADIQSIDFFEIQWKKREEQRWVGRKFTDNNSTSITIPIKDLERNASFHFKVRWTTKDGVEGPFSDISDDIVISMSQKPGKPKGVINSDQGVLLSWEVSSADLQVIDFFEIQWKKREEQRWVGRKFTDNNSTSITIPIKDFKRNASFHFKVRWTTKDGVEGPFSDISDDIVIRMSEQPGKPKVVMRNDQEVLLSWDISSADLQTIHFFEIQWKKREDDRWSGRKLTDNNSTSITIPITDLERNAAFQFKVRWITQDGVESSFSDISDDIIIKMSQKPEKPKGVKSSDGDLLINWGVSSSDLQAIDFFEIHWKKKDDTNWLGRKCTKDNSTSIPIPVTELEMNTAYQFKVRWTTNTGSESHFSDVSDDIIIFRSKQPDKPNVVITNDDDLEICWNVSPSDLQMIGYFEIQWKRKEDANWTGRKCSQDNSRCIKISSKEFANSIAYQFRVRWVTKKDEESAFSEISDDIFIMPCVGSKSRSDPRQPGKVFALELTSNSAKLQWKEPKETEDTITYYEVKYRECAGVQWSSENTTGPSPRLEIKELKSKTLYQFKVRAILSDGNEGPFSEVSDDMSTMESLGARVKVTAQKLHDGHPPIYRLLLKFPHECRNSKFSTRKALLGPRNPVKPTKTIMMVGATGAGKSTLIEGMINYIMDVAWDDDFRFTLIDVTKDEEKNAKSQAKSQTKWITCYEINHQAGSRVAYNLNIVDTPGFGDTEGIERDKTIVNQIHEFFEAPGEQGIDSIDAVCFVTQAPLARLTHTQKYIFDSILSIFGKDINDNIFVLITFADGKAPPVLEALKEAKVPFKKEFLFNNSALFAVKDASNEAKFTQHFWKLGVASFDVFFNELKNVEAKSLQLTSEILDLRRQIENTIERLQPQIQKGIHKMNTLKRETEVLEKHKNEIEANKNFTYTVEEIKQEMIYTKPGHYVTNCLVCNFTCHTDCSIADDNKKDECIAMRGGYCTACPKSCHWSKHRNNSFLYEPRPVTVTKTYDSLEKKYNCAVDSKQKQQTLLGSIKLSLKKKWGKVVSMIQTVRCSINKLEEGALRPNPLNEVSYVNLLIESEQREAKYGWEMRLKVLHTMRKKAMLLQTISNTDELMNLSDEEIATFLESM